MTTICVVTATGTNASVVGEAHSWPGVGWRNSVDCCDCDGHGRVFLDCQDEETAEFVEEQLETDVRVVSYSRHAARHQLPTTAR